MHVTAIIAAGGAGLRLGAGVPKQLLEVGEISILQRSVSAFGDHPGVNEIIVALPPELAAAPPIRAGRWLGVQRSWSAGRGGRTRWRTPSRPSARDTEIVLIHDAARPLVTDDLISRTIEAAARHGAAIAAQPVSDTVKRVSRMAGRCGDYRDDSARIDFPRADAAGISR